MEDGSRAYDDGEDYYDDMGRMIDPNDNKGAYRQTKQADVDNDDDKSFNSVDLDDISDGDLSDYASDKEDDDDDKNEKDKDKKKKQAEYDAFGNPVFDPDAADEHGNLGVGYENMNQETQYDEYGNLIPAKSQQQYDEFDNPIESQPQFDEFGNPYQQDDQQRYDEFGNPIETPHQYDEFGSQQYDEFGNPIETQLQYDEFGNPYAQDGQQYDEFGNPMETLERQQQYDEYGNPTHSSPYDDEHPNNNTQQQNDDSGNPRPATDPQEQQQQYAPDAGRRSDPSVYRERDPLDADDDGGPVFA